MSFQVENIPDSDFLYYRIHKVHIRSGEVKPSAFSEQGKNEDKGMSSDWSKYSTPQQSKERVKHYKHLKTGLPKNPEDNGIVNFIVEHLRNIFLDVIHHPYYNPIPELCNQSHSLIKGIDKVTPEATQEMQLKLLDLFQWEIFPSVQINKNNKNFKIATS